MKLELLLLGILGLRPATGYELKKYFDAHGRFLRANTQMSQVYRALAKMNEDGWVRFEVDPRPGPQDAKTYHLTDAGLTALREWLAGPYTPPEWFTDREFVARLSFAGYLTEDELLRLIDTELDTRRAQVARDRNRDRSLDYDAVPAFDAELEFGIGNRLHEWGSNGIDLYIEHIARLREDLVSGRLRAEGRATLQGAADGAQAPAPKGKRVTTSR
ncbi:PadR family transcriptional regulator AphA [Nocardia sp. GAS34]|uniref:PadR family transcriptional regulator n=1 Tax=unclassified Nocardia TaxID=2637762 RepID=UPI003D1952B5